MADHKSKRGGQDRARITKTQPYEVNYFRRKHNLSQEQANKIIDQHGNDRDAANKAAERLKK